MYSRLLQCVCCCKANVAFFVVAEESLCDRVFVNTHLPVGQTLRLFIANGDKVSIRKCWKHVATFPPFSGNCNELEQLMFNMHEIMFFF